MGLLVAREVRGDRDHFAPIEADALARYPFFERLGFFGVEQGQGHGMRRFLRTSHAILERPGSALWITPQGTFADPRSRPLALKPGLGSLISRLDRAVVVPLALEYAWWEERKPEALARFGYPFHLEREWLRSPQEWSAVLAERLEETQEALATESMARDPRMFEVLTYGGSGVGGVYDLMRRARSALRGEQFRPEHGTIR